MSAKREAPQAGGDAKRVKRENGGAPPARSAFAAGSSQIKRESGVKIEPSVKAEHKTQAELDAEALDRQLDALERKGAAKLPDGTVCPYLDSIDRKVLDFDFEKLCSVSLSKLNVYACLICGKYFQGRGKNSHAYFHSLEQDHRVFMNLKTEKVYCLPDGYEVKDASLDDIVHNLHPNFSKREVAQLHNNTTLVHALDGTDYLPGVIGLNNIKNTDWLNVTVQVLMTVAPLRNFFLLEKNWVDKAPSDLVRRFGEIFSKMWNPRRFTGHVSPHELLQAISHASDKRFRIGEQADPIKFLSWFLNVLHKDLGGTRKRGSSIVHQCFQGELSVEVEEEVEEGQGKAKKDKSEEEMLLEDEDEDDANVKITKSRKPFLLLSLDLPAAPLFKDEDTAFIPQVPLFELLSKFDGNTAEILPDGKGKRRYTLSRLPRFLIVHIKRFHENNWFVEKNPTLVNFPIKNLDMKPYMTQSKVPTTDEIRAMSVKDLKKQLKKRKLPCDAVEKEELVKRLAKHYETVKIASKYDLVANICHDGKPKDGHYRMHRYHKAANKWYEMEDLHVWTTETMPQLVALSETYIQVYELQRP